MLRSINLKERKPISSGFSLLSFARRLADPGSSLSIGKVFCRLNRQKTLNKNGFFSFGQRGYTLVELNMSIVVLGIITVSILAIFTNYFVVITRNSNLLQMSVDSQALLRTMTEELRYGAGVRVTNSISDANGPSGGWNTSNSAFVIITAMPALNSANEYILDPNTGEPYLNEMVYYKLGDIMYKRSLANQGATGNRTQTSCPAALASVTCPADIRLIDDVSDMNFVLYDQDDVTTNDPLLARSIIINLSMERDSFGSPLVYTNSIRTTLRNTF